MTTFFTSITNAASNAFLGAYNTIMLSAEKVSKTFILTKTSEVAASALRNASSYYPESLKFKVFSKETAGGVAIAMIAGAIINKVRS